MMDALTIPASPDAVTPAWLTQALRSAGILTHTTVTSCAMAELGEGQGCTGRLVRFRMAYDGADEGAPPSLVAKFPTADPYLRAALNRHGIYEREIRFYKGYEFTQCRHDYRLSMLQVLCRVVIAGALLDFTSERGRALAEALIHRCAAALEDHNIAALIPA